MQKSYYITTPIYYPSGEPHLGHVYTTITADALARFYRLCGRETFFLTGTDEHGIKMVKTAEKQGLTPQALADSYAQQFKQAFAEMKISNDDFIRTTEARHKSAVQQIVRKMIEKDDIYLGTYEGWYDEGEENFVTETEAKAGDYKSPVSGRPLTRYQEPSYFFRLSKYIPRLIEKIEGDPDFIRPESRRREVLSKLLQGVGDLSISRSTLKWGVPMPNDPEHVVYVWIDALSNYVTALGYASDDDSRFRKFWPVDVHLIGKEILWFHTVYWPAMLMSLEVELPRTVFAHGWWVVKDTKMSKSLGNFIGLGDLRALIDQYGLDAVRFYLLRAAPFGNDLEWSDDEFARSYRELSDVLGNCLNRLLKMIERYRKGVLPSAGEAEMVDQKLIDETLEIGRRIEVAYDQCELQQCATLPVDLARSTNGYIDTTAPFLLAKDPSQARRLETVLHHAAQAISRALIALLPVLPDKAADGLGQLGVSVEGKTIPELLATPLPSGKRLGKAQPLFPRMEREE